jgi:hypothetical protein
MTESQFWSMFKAGTESATIKMDEGLILHWTRIENVDGSGVPDAYGFMSGMRNHAWVELKVAKGRKVKVQPSQIAWHTRHAEDRTFIVVRRDDEMLVFAGRDVAKVNTDGIDAPWLFRTKKGDVGAGFDWSGLIYVLFLK